MRDEGEDSVMGFEQGSSSEQEAFLLHDKGEDRMIGSEQEAFLLQDEGEDHAMGVGRG